MTATAHPTRNTLSASIREQVIDLLNERLSDAIELQLQAKQAHWNVKGAQFIALHRLFDEVAAAANEYSDLLAERVVQLGGTAPGLRTSPGEPSLPAWPADITSCEEIVAALSAGLAAFGERMRLAVDEVTYLGDTNAADICTEISRGTDKWLWFVEAHSG